MMDEERGSMKDGEVEVLKIPYGDNLEVAYYNGEPL
jgi:hypothetical protein